MLSAFKAQPTVELKSRDKSKIESLLAYGEATILGWQGFKRANRKERRQTSCWTQLRRPSRLPDHRPKFRVARFPSRCLVKPEWIVSIPGKGPSRRMSP